MTLEEYRRHLIERFKACGDASAARNLVAEAELMLANSRLAPVTQAAFWEELHQDLDILLEDTKFMTDRQASVKLSTIVLAAQARIARSRPAAMSDD